MRIYTNPLEAVRETERDLWEMGIRVHPQTMQDKVVVDDADYETREIRGYGFKIADWTWHISGEEDIICYLLPIEQQKAALEYIAAEFNDRIGGVALNPGSAWDARKDVWNEFLHDGKFAYTYSERITPQLDRIMQELDERPETRQGIINIHSNIIPWRLEDDSPPPVIASDDLNNMGGGGRVPCSMYYQLMVREGKVDLIYTMRSCDFLVHFPIDLSLALRLQSWVANQLGRDVGCFTYFAGSFHAYAKEMRVRGIF